MTQRSPNRIKGNTNNEFSTAREIIEVDKEKEGEKKKEGQEKVEKRKETFAEMVNKGN